MSDKSRREKRVDNESNITTEKEEKKKGEVATGEGVSLAGKIIKKGGALVMGDRAQPAKPSEALKQKLKEKPKKKAETEGKVLGDKKKSKFQYEKGANVLNVDISESLVYHPKTKENRLLYEQLLSIIHQCLGDVPQDVLKSVTDEALAVLKMDDMKDNDKKTEIEGMIDKISPELFGTMLNIAKQINDYTPEEQANLEERDEELKIGVVFDEEEGQDEDEDIVDEVVEPDEEENMEEEPEGEQLAVGTKGGLEDVAVEEDEMDLDPNDIDAYWIQKELNKEYNDPIQAQKDEKEILEILNLPTYIECENKLVSLLGFDRIKLITLFLKNRHKIYYCTRLKQAQSSKEKEQIIEEMKKTEEGEQILYSLEQGTGRKDKDKNLARVKKETSNLSKQGKETGKDLDIIYDKVTITDEDFSKISKKALDLESLTFQQGGHFMSNEKCSLPPGSYKLTKKGYEEVYIPALKYTGDDRPNVKISDLPNWAQPAFAGFKELNRIQSRVFHCAFETPENMLVCAPTGAGKTNIALLTILHQMGLYRKKNGEFDLTKFKIIYIAPMKALVSEIVGALTNRLRDFGVVVRELTGDMQLTKQQIQETQVIVATPEKWDIITRKSGDRAYLDLVKLIIIDEIHLLHDSRGPVLETIVARTIRTIEQTQELIRIVGLSATLPNYADVAAFIRVNPEPGKGLFYFDNSFRPVPLEQQYIGVTEKKAVKRMLLMNEILYEKVIERAGVHQIIVFVHSRRDTAKTAKALKEMALARDELGKFLKADSTAQTILQSEAERAINPDLKELLPFGFAIHHAGLRRADREAVEDLFNNKKIQVLVSTATLAWGVNLPAHTVIIKGTQVYSPEQGKWVELSPQDILQMMGRAGRPLHDTKGEGIIITTYTELKFYLSLFNHQLPIESQFISQLADQLNAEIVLGTIMNIRDAVNWLGYTYLYIRMLRSPTVYGIPPDEYEADRLLIKRRTDLIHSAALLLDKHNLIKYDRKTGLFQVTALGKIASHYYIKYPSIATFNEHIKPNMGIIDLFRVFSLSHEFKYVPIREEEKAEIQKLLEMVPIPVKGSPEENSTKVNILLQAYISRLKLEGFALNADMAYITQSAARIFRGLFELFLKRGWASIAEITLNVCKMVDKRMWNCMTPLRQFPNIPEEILRRIEKKELFTWEHYYNMSVQQIGELIKFPKFAKDIHRMIHQFPRLELNAYVQPITRSTLKVELTITPDFQWNHKIHGTAEPFWIFVYDADGEIILYYEHFVLKEKYLEEKENVFEFTVPLFDPMHPQYFIKVISDRWVACEAQLPISLRHLIMPEKFPPHTELFDLQLLPISSLRWPEAEQLLRQYPEFNAIQTQVFSAFYNSDDNIFLGAPTGSGKTLCAIIAILRCIREYPKMKVVYVCPFDSVCREKYRELNPIFKGLGCSVVMLTGQPAADTKALERGDIIISSPESWDMISRRWKQRKQIQQIRLFVADELHLLTESDSTLEVITSRMRYIANQIEKPIRIIGLATSVANSRDVAEWIGANPSNTFNFHPNVRPIPLEIYLQGFDQTQRKVRLLAMSRHIFQGIKHHAQDRPVIIFVSDRKQARLTALDLVTMAGADNNPKRFLHLDSEDLAPFLNNIAERTLKHCLEYGVGFIYEGMDESEREQVERLYNAGAIQLLVSTYSLCWELNLNSYMVVIMDTQRYNGRERRYVDYSIPDMLQMMGKAGRPKLYDRRSGKLREYDDNSKCIVYCHTPKKEFYKKFLFESLPVESTLNQSLGDHLNAEIVGKTIENKQDCVDWITWTFFYRRLTQNPNFYNLQGVSGNIINDYLSNLVEETVEELANSKCISIDENEMDLSALNLGMIASYYYIKYSTIDLFAKSLSPTFKMKQILEILCAATEFETIPIRHGEDKILKQLSTEITHKIEKPKFNEPDTKTNILLQCHFSRIPLSSDFIFDQKIILEKAAKLIPALVDVISSSGYLRPAILAMHLSQMIVQAMWINDSPLYQLPHFDKELVNKCLAAKIEDIADLLNMDDEERLKLLNMTDSQLEDVARVCNRYPSITMNFRVASEEILSGETAIVEVNLEREASQDEEERIDFVHAPYFPKEKEEFMWVVLGDTKNNKLYGLKRVSFPDKLKIDVKFIAPEEGEHELNLYLISDSWVGCDQSEKLRIKVEPNPDQGEDEGEN